MMKILLLTPDLPYPSESGVALRSCGIIRGLHAAGHEITLLSFGGREPIAADNPLLDWCKDIHALPLPPHSRAKRIRKLLFSAEADMEHRLADADFEAALKNLLRDEAYDLVQFFGIEFGRYLPLMFRRGRNAKIVYDAQNAEADLQRAIADIDRRSLRRLPASLYSRIQTRRLTRLESEICRAVDLVAAVSGEDRELLQRHGGAPIHVVPNGIHADDYREPAGNLREAHQLVFSGKMDYRPNVDAMEWFCAEILPRVRQQLPQTEVVIVGRNPHARIKAKAGDSVRITGWVESVQPYLHHAAVYIVPLRMGSGTRLKVLQALASGCAVVSTSLGAAGLHDEALSTLRIADDADGFARAVTQLLRDESARLDMGRRAQESARKHYDWAALMPRLLRAYRSIGLG